MIVGDIFRIATANIPANEVSYYLEQLDPEALKSGEVIWVKFMDPVPAETMMHALRAAGLEGEPMRRFLKMANIGSGK